MSGTRLSLGCGGLVSLVVTCFATGATVGAFAVQAMSIATSAAGLQVKAPAFTFLDGAVLTKLRDGQAVRIDLELTVLPKRGAGPAATTQQQCQFSFDLWEERFAVKRVSTPPRTISHVTARDAETWCVDALAVPLAALSGLGRDTPFWLRLTSRMQNRASAPSSGEDPVFTLGRLIEMLSRRGEQSEPLQSIEAGPFRLPR